jgi:hypothetical protein
LHAICDSIWTWPARPSPLSGLNLAHDARAGAVFGEAPAQTDERVFGTRHAPGFNRKELLKFRKMLVRSFGTFMEYNRIAYVAAHYFATHNVPGTVARLSD